MATSSQPSDTDKARERDADILKRLKEYRQQNKPGVKMANGAGFGTVNRLFGPAKGIKKELLRLHPSGKKACSDDLVEKAKKLNLRLEHLGTTIGTVIHGVDLRQNLSSEVVQTLKQALNERKVIFFRDQDLTREQHIAFGRYFGQLEIHPFGAPVEGYPEILPIYADENAAGSINNWHSDVTWRTEPSLGSILYMRECPDLGGDTLFSDSHAAFDGLPENIQMQALGKTAIHDFDGFRRTQLRLGVPKSFIEELRQRYPLAIHPVIRTHPETGKQGIYVNRAFTKYIDGLHTPQSQILFNRLCDEAKRPEYQCRFQWKKGSIAFWDNRAVQHYAASDYFPFKRALDRVTVCGDAPFFIDHRGKM